MRMHGRLLVLAFVTLPAGLSAESQDAKPIPAGRASLSGRVIDSDSKHPLAAVMIALLSEDGTSTLRTTTDGDGRYQFDGIGPGSYRVAASADGYAPQEYGGRDDWVTRQGRVTYGRMLLGMREGQVRTGVDFAMRRGGSITGRVTNADGRPVKSADVRAVLLLDDHSFTFSATTQARTSDSGEYTIRDLQPGLYRVSATWIDPAALQAGVGVDTRATYFPGTGSPHEAASLKLAAGSLLRNIDIPLAPSDVFRLAGHVLRGGSTDAGIEAYVASSSKSVRAVPIRDEGAFEITHLPPGRHTLWARATTDGRSEAVAVTLDLASDMTGLVLPMMAASEMTGRVVTVEGQVFAGGGTQVIADLVDGDGNRVDAVPHDRADIDADGRFHLRHLFGLRALRVSGNDWEISRVLHGKTAIETFSLTAGDHLEDVVVVVTRR
jgi:hypothetical protein